MYKDFQFRPAPPADDAEGPEGFRVHVLNSDDEEVRVEEFRIVDYAPLNAFAQLGTAMVSGRIAGNAGTDRFIRTMIVPEERQRWALLIADPDLRIDANEIGPIVQWLVEVLSDRPTVRPSASPDGPSPNGATSTDAAPSTGPTPAS